MFQKSVLNSFSQNESLVEKRWANFQNFISKINAIKSFKEEEYQDGFLQDIFESCLGYTLKTTNPNSFNLEREKKNETDSKKADAVIYLKEQIIGVIELKAQDTKNLDRVQQQAFYYLSQHSNSKFVIISNFDELRFYIEKSTSYEKFNLFNLNFEEFKKLHLLLAYENLEKEIALKAKEKSNSFEQNISKELYKDYSKFRTELFENIIKNNFGTGTLVSLGTETLVSAIKEDEAEASFPNKTTLLRLTQKLCDRIIFILFAEDRDLLQANTIHEIRSRHSIDMFGYSLYDYYKIYFEAINKGNSKINVPQYNGGLFAKDELLDSLKIDDFVLDENVQNLSNYDFLSDISVNILGHIFEQSLTDLEELQANIENIDFDKSKSKRKKDGVFYTPEYITKYIVENTLGIMCKEKREELNIGFIGTETLVSANKKTKEQIKQNLLTYKDWLLNLKILDPACGSGAFLNQALEFLISEHKTLQNDLALMGDLFASYMVEEIVLENNLYGVDLSEDAVEIAKLSLWLRTATKERPLTRLADKIKCGNSLIDDKNISSKAFVWEEEFKEVFEQGGFDIIIGNPPYVQTTSNIYQNYKTYLSGDLYVYFFEKSISLLNNKGYCSLITPSLFIKGMKYETLRTYLLETTEILELLDKGDNVFSDAKIPTAITTLIKNNNSTQNWSDFIPESKLIYKLNNQSLKIKEISTIMRGLEIGKNKVLEDKQNIRFLTGENISRYNIKNYSYITDEIYEEFKKDNYFFTKNRLLIRETGSVITTVFLDDEITQNNRSLYSIKIINNNEFDTKYILTILNSKIIQFYYQNMFATNTDLFPKIRIGQVKEIPIKNISLEEQKPFIEKAELMLELNKKLQETKENFIFELKLKKVPRKLQNFEELDFDDFVKEYAKAKKIKFADKLEERNFKNDWQRLFENDKKEVLELQEQINITDKEIDNMVYKLYDLTEDEIKIVEN